VKFSGFEVTPPELTVTLAVDGLATSLAGTEAVNSVALTKVVVSAAVFHKTLAPEANPVPVTVKVNAPLPAVVVAGLSELMVGTGAASTVNVSVFEVTPPDFTLTEAVPGLAISLAGTEAVNWVALTNAVLSGAVFHRTLAPDANPVPVTVRVNAPLPALVVAGFSNVMAGPATTVKFNEFDVTPPADLTLTETVAGLAM
jgi:hypothetical protein